MSEEYEAKKSLLEEINKRVEQRNNNTGENAPLYTMGKLDEMALQILKVIEEFDEEEEMLDK